MSTCSGLVRLVYKSCLTFVLFWEDIKHREGTPSKIIMLCLSKFCIRTTKSQDFGFCIKLWNLVCSDIYILYPFTIGWTLVRHLWFLWLLFASRSWFIILGNGFGTCINKSNHCKNRCGLFSSRSIHCALYCPKCKIFINREYFPLEYSVKVYQNFLFSHYYFSEQWTLRGLCIGECLTMIYA